MVQHNDKWKKKASREYHKKHGTFPVGRGRGRGRGGPADEPPAEVPLTAEDEEQEESEDDCADDSNAEVGEGTGSQKERSRYARRKVESNAWRFESEEPDPYLCIQSIGIPL
jgi:hypothetical protein